MNTNKKRLGMMFYFDMLPTLEEFTNEEVGQVFRALLKYGLTGEETSFTDRGVRALWKEMKKKADWDGEKYKTVCVSRQYAVYCREAKRKGLEPLSQEEWERFNDHMISNDDFDIQQQITTATPTQTTSSERKTTATSVTALSPTAAETTNSAAEGGVGETQAAGQVMHRDDHNLCLSENVNLIFQQYLNACREESVQTAMDLRLLLENEYGCDIQELMRREGYDSG